MTERPRKNHFGDKIARGMLREQGLLEAAPQYEALEYEYPGDRFREHLRNIEERMNMEEAGE